MKNPKASPPKRRVPSVATRRQLREVLHASGATIARWTREPSFPGGRNGPWPVGQVRKWLADRRARAGGLKAVIAAATSRHDRSIAAARVLGLRLSNALKAEQLRILREGAVPVEALDRALALRRCAFTRLLRGAEQHIVPQLGGDARRCHEILRRLHDDVVAAAYGNRIAEKPTIDEADHEPDSNDGTETTEPRTTQNQTRNDTGAEEGPEMARAT